MVASQKYQNKKIAIYGMGLTGCSAARTLKKLGAEIICWDDNAKTRKKIKNLNFPLNKFWLKQAFLDNIVISPGIDINKCIIRNYLRKNSLINVGSGNEYSIKQFATKILKVVNCKSKLIKIKQTTNE